MESDGEIVKSPQLHQRLVGAGQRLAAALLDQLYPPGCLVCNAPTQTHDTLCGTCFAQFRPISAPLCPILGVPFETSLGDGAVSAEALANPPPFARARAAVIYNDPAALLVSRLKYGDRPELARFCARLMASAGHELFVQRPILVPVPLHPLRQFQRRYNQSLELGRALARLTGLKLDPTLVRRIKRTRQQVGLSADGRDRNMVGAFAAHPDANLRSKGQSVVLIDDVYTTGATVKAATRVLKRAGIEQVSVLTFARVVSGEQIPI